MQGPSGHSAVPLTWQMAVDTDPRWTLSAGGCRTLWTRDRKGLNGKADLSLKEAVVGEGGQSVTGGRGGAQGLAPVGARQHWQSHAHLVGTVRGGRRKPKAKTFLRSRDKGPSRKRHHLSVPTYAPPNKQGLWRPKPMERTAFPFSPKSCRGSWAWLPSRSSILCKPSPGDHLVCGWTGPSQRSPLLLRNHC